MRVTLLTFVLVTACACDAPSLPLACASDAECPDGARCDPSLGFCTAVQLATDDDGLAAADAGVTEDAGVVAPDGAPTINAFTVLPARVQQHESATVSWQVTDAATCSLAVDDGVVVVEHAVPAEGTLVITPLLTSAVTLACTGEDDSAARTEAVEVALPKDIADGWPDLALPYRIDVALTASALHEAAPMDVALDLAALLPAGFAFDPDSVRLVARDDVGAPLLLELYYAADVGLLFVPMRALADDETALLEVYFGPTALDAPPWSPANALYDDDFAGVAAPLVMNAHPKDANEVAPLAVHGFAVAKVKEVPLLYTRAARLVVDGDAATTRLGDEFLDELLDDVLDEPFDENGLGTFAAPLDGGSVARFRSAVFSVLETRVPGPNGVVVHEIVTTNDDSRFLRFATVVKNAGDVPAPDVRFATLMDIDVPTVGLPLGDDLNRADVSGGTPHVCGIDFILCAALAGDQQPAVRVGQSEDVTLDFLSDDFTLGATDESAVLDMRMALAWDLGTLGAGAERVLHHALAANNETQPDAIDVATERARSLVAPHAVDVGPVWIDATRLP